MLNYREVFLLDCDLQILESASSGAVLSLCEAEASFLLSINFIAPYRLSDRKNQYVVTPEGLRFKEFWDKQKAQAQEERRRELIRTWTPIVISNAIAFAALLISLLK